MPTDRLTAWCPALYNSAMRTITAFIKLGRLHFLAGGVVLHLLGVVMALVSGADLNVAALVWGQVAITAVQLMTHYANDTFDLAADQANTTPTNWSGGSRVLVEGGLSARAALITALVLAGIALVANLVLSLTIRPGVTTFALLLTAQVLAWFYSAPPIRLHSRGLGELTTAITVTLLTPLTGFYLQTGSITALPLLAAAPLCCFQFAMLLAIEFPDAEGDQAVGKRTLVVRLGARMAARVYVGVVLIAYALLPLLVALGLPLLVVVGVAVVSPLALLQIRRIMRGDGQNVARWNGLAFYSIVLLVASASAELVAFVLVLGMN